MRLFPILVLLLCAPLIAAADEVWDTPDGLVRYLTDEGDTAVFGDTTRRMYIPGLAGNFNARGVHTGYWIGDGPDCGARMIGPDGFEGPGWGQLRVVFHDAAFPSDWTMVMGTCFADPETALQGKSPLNR